MVWYYEHVTSVGGRMNCLGCSVEFDEAISAQDNDGLYYATSLDREYRRKGHFLVWMVNDAGKVIIE
jgi:hypothetical protein